MARRQIPRGVVRRHTAIKIKVAFKGNWMDRETAAKALRAIGYSDIEALAYLDRKDVEVIRV